MENANVHKIGRKSKKDIIEKFIDNENYDDAFSLNTNVYEEALGTDDFEMIAFGTYFFGLIEEKRGDIHEALVYYKKATILSREYKINECLVKTLNRRGIIYWLDGRIHVAIEKYLEAIRIIDTDSSVSEVKERLLNNVGVLYIEAKEYDRAIQYLLQCAFKCEESKNELILTTAYSNLTDAFIKSGKLVNAKQYNYLSKEISLKINDQVGIAIALSQEAVILHKENKPWENVNQLFQESLKIVGFRKFDLDKIDILHRYAEEAFRAGYYELAESILIETLKSSKDKSYNTLEIRGLRTLEQIYIDTSQYEKAYGVTKRQSELNEEAYLEWKKISLESVDKNILVSSELSKVDSLQKSIRTLTRLSDIGQKITSCIDAKGIYNILIEDARKVFDSNAFGIGIIGEDGISVGYRYYDEDKYAETTILLEDERYLMTQCIKTGEDIIIYNTQSIDEMAESQSTVMKKILKNVENKTILFCPIKFENNTIGGVTVQSYEMGKLTYVDLESLRVLATYIAIAFTNLNRSAELLKAKEKIEETAKLDGLTGAFNRLALRQYTEKRTKEWGFKYSPSAALMIDIDYFKQYNDNYGHIMGDSFLVSVCSMLRSSLENSDYKLFRYGGDEFFVVIENCHESQIVDILDRIILQMEELHIEHLYSKTTNYATLTIGATIVESPVEEYNLVFARADAALYKAKANGKNQYLIQ